MMAKNKTEQEEAVSEIMIRIRTQAALIQPYYSLNKEDRIKLYHTISENLIAAEELWILSLRKANRIINKLKKQNHGTK